MKLEHAGGTAIAPRTPEDPLDLAVLFPNQRKFRMEPSRRVRALCTLLSITLLLLVNALPALGADQLRSTSEDVTYLEYALRTERWLRQQAASNELGKIWRSADEVDDHPTTNGNLYYGSSGVILFYLELYEQTGRKTFLDEAKDGARYLMATVPDALFYEKSLNALELFPSLNQPVDGLPVFTAANGLGHPNQPSLYWGVSGIGFTLGEMYRVTGNPAYRHSAWQIVELLMRDHHSDESGATWGSTPELQIGDAGVGLFLLYAARELAHPGAEDLAREIGNSLLARGTASGGGLMWSTKSVYGTDYPNFSHGSAGIGYFLAVLYGQTGDDRYLTGANGVGSFLLDIADESGLIAHHLPDDGLRYYGWCHGPAGTNRLFERLSRAEPLETPTPEWSRYIERSNRAVIEAEIIDRDPAGFWENVGQCCGSAGIADHFLKEYARTGKPEYLEFAKSMSEDILLHATSTNDQLHWNHSEHRSTPQFSQTLTGYMQGASGIGMHFLRMHALPHGKQVSIRLLDDRF